MNKKPKCIIVTGQPGSGKTTLAKRLGERLWMPVISRDEIKEGYVNTYAVKHDQLSPDTNALISNFLFGIVHQYLAGNISIVIEAAFQHAVWESRMPELFEVASPLIIICSLDGAAAASRHLQRGLENPNREFYHGDKRVAHYRKTGEVLPPDKYIAPKFDVPTVHVSTAGEYLPSLEEIAQQIQELRPQHPLYRGIASSSQRSVANYSAITCSSMVSVCAPWQHVDASTVSAGPLRPPHAVV